MRLTIHRSDGKSGKYFQDDAGRADILSCRLDPATLFTTGPIVIGVLNPFTILNADEVCWIEVESERELPRAAPASTTACKACSIRRGCGVSRRTISEPGRPAYFPILTNVT